MSDFQPMHRILNFIDLHRGEEAKDKVLENVISNISFRGSNLWILACAIVIASVGLNVNSAAVVIGAMLISPLMGPIVGAGFALGVFDFTLFRKSLKNLVVATAVGLLVSAAYFFVTPFKDPQSEILARTAPNIYDVIIAFFGGLVGVIAITRVEKGNPIPGVAIATALMPPLCTAGFGLATGNIKFFFGAIYLYTINCVFICIATFLIVKYLRYPVLEMIDRKRQKRVRQIMTFLILVMIMPSVYFAYVLFEERKFNERVNTFITHNFTNRGYPVIYRKTRYNSNPKAIELAFLNRKFRKSEIDSLQARLKDYEITNTNLIIRQDTLDLKKDILSEIGGDRQMTEKDKVIANLQNEINRNKYDTPRLLTEVKVLFPEIEDISLSNHYYSGTSAKDKFKVVALYKSKTQLKPADAQKLSAWLAKRVSRNDVSVFWEKAQ